MSSRIQSQEIQNYWDQCTDLYLRHMTTFQAGLFAVSGSVDPFRENALEIGRRADIRAGHRVLDLGCGVCGPAIEIAKQDSSISFVSATNCSRQVEVARERIRYFGLEQQIEVVLLDYHEIDNLSGSFDRCLFLESFGYTLSPIKLLEGVLRSLEPRGKLYIKDVCHKWNLSVSEAVELEVFNSTYCYNTPLFRDVRANTQAAGFGSLVGRIVTSEMYRDHSRKSMFVEPGLTNELTEFGRHHFKGFINLPIDFFELIACKPAQV